MPGRTVSLLVCLLLGAAWLTACGGTSSDRSGGGPGRPQPRVGGEPLRDPPEVVSRHGVLRTTLVLERRRVPVGNRTLWALTYNGRYMPPTLRVRPGDRIELALVNRVHAKVSGVTTDTNLHTHGLHVSPRPPADDIFLAVRSGTTYHYDYRLPRDATPGTYWYHSHVDGYSAAQVAGGESGLIVVDGLRSYLPRPLRHLRERVIALKDDQVAGDSVRIAPLSIGAATHRTVNGQHNPLISIRPGETQLWRIANIGANIYYRLHLQGRVFHVIAQDGHPVHRVYAAGTLLVPAGSRFDVLVQGGEPGVSWLETLPFDSGPAGNRFPRADLATVVTQGPASTPASVPTAFAPEEDLGKAPVAGRKTMVYTETATPERYFVNGRTFDPNRVDFTSRLDTVEEWTVRNDTDEDHSFHVHTDHFQVMSLGGKDVDPSHSWYETVNIPRHRTLVLRIRFSDFTGRTVLHCHILNHEDKGMMAVLDIVKGGPDPSAVSAGGK